MHMNVVERASPGAQSNAAIKASLFAIGEQELLLRDTDRPTSSRFIGQACLAASGQRNSHSALRHFRHARAAIRAEMATESGMVAQSRLRFAELNLQLLRMHNQPTAVSQLREELHLATVRELAELSRRANSTGRRGERADLIGYCSELTARALITRSQDPYVTALQALAHHDADEEDSTQNYDILLVDCTGSAGRPATAKIQVKSGCLGFCGEDSNPTQSRKRYKEDIVMVSSHCDLGVGGTSIREQLRTRELLVQEEYGTILPADRLTLDDVSDHLRLAVTDPAAHRLGAVALY